MGFLKKIFGKLVFPSSHDRYIQMLQNCVEEIQMKNTNLQKNYGFGKYDRWDMNQGDGKLIFSENGEPKVICDIMMLGSYSIDSKTWRWSWANDTVVPELKNNFEKVKEYGKQNSYDDLIDDEFGTDEAGAWEMSAIATKILGGKGIYRAPCDNIYIFMMIKEISNP